MVAHARVISDIHLPDLRPGEFPAGLRVRCALRAIALTSRARAIAEKSRLIGLGLHLTG